MKTTASASSADTTRSKARAPAGVTMSTPSRMETRGRPCTAPGAAAGCEDGRLTSSPDLIGAHTSIAGGTQLAPGRAKAIKATAMQIFTKMGQRWAERECVDD